MLSLNGLSSTPSGAARSNQENDAGVITKKRKKYPYRFFYNLFITITLCFRCPVFLETDPDWRYNTLNKPMASVMGGEQENHFWGVNDETVLLQILGSVYR